MTEEIEMKKAYLMGYQESKRAVKRLEKELEELKKAGQGMCDKEKQKGIREKIIKERYERIKRFEEIRGKIEEMKNEREKDALIYRYISGMSEENAADCMGYTVRQYMRIWKRAMENINI